MLGWLVEDKGIAPHVPIWDKSERNDHTFETSDFTWDEKANEYRCPAGRVLRRQWRAFTHTRTHLTKAETIVYRSSQKDCQACRLKSPCCPNTPMRQYADAQNSAQPP